MASNEAPMIAEFLIIAITRFPNGGITVRTAWGSTILVMVRR
jgi:hypothetical protein